jgi:hypothetical protein
MNDNDEGLAWGTVAGHIAGKYVRVLIRDELLRIKLLIFFKKGSILVLLKLGRLGNNHLQASPMRRGDLITDARFGARATGSVGRRGESSRSLPSESSLFHFNFRLKGNSSSIVTGRETWEGLPRFVSRLS